MKRSFLVFSPLLGAALLAAILSACGSSDAIFWTLEQERELVDDRGIPDDITVLRVVRAPGAPARLFAAAGRVYWREDAAGAQWQTVAPPAGISGAMCNQIEYFDASGASDIAAWFYNTNDVYDNGLYTLNPGDIAAGWTAVATLPALTKRRAELLKVVNGQLFLAVSHYVDPDTLHALYSFDSAYNVPTAAVFPVLDAPATILDVEHDGATYWIATLPNATPTWLYTGALGALAADLDPPVMTVTASRPPGALFYNAGDGNLYLSSENGKIFYRNGAWSTWTGDPVQVDSQNVRFTRFVKAHGTTLFVGTRSHGYYSFVQGTAGSAADLTRGPSYNVSDLYNGAVLGFLGVGLPDTLFACTYGNGLWRADYDAVGSDPWPWVQE